MPPLPRLASSGPAKVWNVKLGKLQSLFHDKPSKGQPALEVPECDRWIPFPWMASPGTAKPWGTRLGNFAHNSMAARQENCFPSSTAIFPRTDQPLGYQAGKDVSPLPWWASKGPTRPWSTRLLTLCQEFHGSQTGELYPIFYCRHPWGWQGPEFLGHVSCTHFLPQWLPTGQSDPWFPD